MDFRWEDGSQILPEFWAEHQPDNNAEHCVLIEMKSNEHLNKKSCYFKKDFICEYENNEELGITCADEWDKVDTSCFKLFSNQMWHKANETCQSHDADLLSIQSLTKFNSVQKYLKKLRLAGNQNDIWVKRFLCCLF